MKRPSKPARTCSDGTSARPAAGTGPAGTPPWPPSPSSGPPPSAARSTAASISPPPASATTTHADTTAGDDISDADLQIPLGDAPVPGRGGQPCPAGIAPIKLSIAETARLAILARQHAAGLITRARLAFALRWSLRRRLHQAIARWHHYSTRLHHHQERVTSADRKEVTECNTIRQPGHHAERQPGHAPGNRDCSTRRALRLLHARESLRSRRYRPGGPYPPPPGVSITNRSPAATATESLPRIGVTEPSACSTQCRPSAPGWPPAIP